MFCICNKTFYVYIKLKPFLWPSVLFKPPLSFPYSCHYLCCYPRWIVTWKVFIGRYLFVALNSMSFKLLALWWIEFTLNTFYHFCSSVHFIIRSNPDLGIGPKLTNLLFCADMLSIVFISRFIWPYKSWTDARFGIIQFVTPITHVLRHPGV